MIRRHLMALRIGLMLLDGLIAAAVFIGVAALRYRDGDANALWRSIEVTPPQAALLFAMLWVLALWTVGLYKLNARWNVWTEVRDIARATLLVIALTLSTLFVFKQNDVSRLYLIILFIAEPTVTLIGRLGFRAVFEAARQRGHNARYMVIAGTGTLAQEFADQLEEHPGLGINVIGHLRAPGERRSVVSRRCWAPSTTSRRSSTSRSSTSSRSACRPAPGTIWSRSPSWLPARARQSASRSSRPTSCRRAMPRRSSIASWCARSSTMGIARQGSSSSACSTSPARPWR